MDGLTKMKIVLDLESKRGKYPLVIKDRDYGYWCDYPVNGVALSLGLFYVVVLWLDVRRAEMRNDGCGERFRNSAWLEFTSPDRNSRKWKTR